MWLAKKLNKKTLKTFVFPSLLPVLFTIPWYAAGLMHVTLVVYWALVGLVVGWLPAKIGWFIARALFPSLPAKCDVRSWRWRQAVVVGLLLILTILLNFLLYYHIGVPEWALLIGINKVPQPWLHGTFFALPITAFIAEFASVLFFAWRLQKRKFDV